MGQCFSPVTSPGPNGIGFARYRMLCSALWFGLVFGALCFGASAQAKSFSGKVLRVVDGDSIELLDGHGDVLHIRLEGIDAPEWDQPFGDVSKAYLRRTIEGKTVRVNTRKQDVYGRWVAQVRIRKTDVSLMQVQYGLAWVFRRYEHELAEPHRQALNGAETAAQNQNLGLWQQDYPMPPWEWRRLKSPYK
ncbi:MAG: thermonuclease family protein [Betaproteobacteria bacterium]|nr:thermonuclease family protein [Betaproteobacteria bacterium]